jgi:GNAT superfamily N-acetyltransferase
MKMHFTSLKLMAIEVGILSDVNEISVLFNEYRIFYGKPSDPEGAQQFLTDRIANQESVIFISRSPDGIITGFLQLYPIFSSTRMKRLWLLNDLYVKPDFRGTGTSVALMDSAKMFSKRTDSCGLVLETAKNNAFANKLYQRIGFVIDNDHNYYSWTE